MKLKELLKSDLKAAMVAKEVFKRDTIRSINNMIKQIEVDERIEVDDDRIISLIQKGIKTRNDSIIDFKKAGRMELVEKEQSQIDIYSVYLPKQLSKDELVEIISAIIEEVGATSMKDMGKVINPAKEKIGANSDGKSISGVVKELLLKK